MNKKGTDKILAIYWFAVFFIVAGVVVVITANFYGSPYDVRRIEGDLLASKIGDCMAFGGYINPLLVNEKLEFNQNFKNNLLGECGLYFGDEKAGEIQHYVEINIFDFNEQTKLLFSSSAGNVNFKQFCSLEQKEDLSGVPFCLERSFYSIDRKNNQFLIKITSIVGQVEKNVK